LYVPYHLAQLTHKDIFDWRSLDARWNHLSQYTNKRIPERNCCDEFFVNSNERRLESLKLIRSILINLLCQDPEPTGLEKKKWTPSSALWKVAISSDTEVKPIQNFSTRSPTWKRNLPGTPEPTSLWLHHQEPLA